MLAGLETGWLVNYNGNQKVLKNEEPVLRKIEFRPAQIKQLSYESIHHPHHIVRRRMQALLLKSQGVLHKEIAKILEISETTLRTYFDLYLSGGVERLKLLHYQGQPSQLHPKKDEIVAALEAEPPATLKEAQAIIKEVTGLERSLTQIGQFLKKTRLSGAR